MQRFGKYLLANNLQASLLALLCILLPWPGNAIAAVLVGLVSLNSVLAGLGILAWVMLPAIAATWKAHSLAVSYDVAFLVCFLCWAFAALLQWQRNWTKLLELVAVFGIVFVALAMLIPEPTMLSWVRSLEKIVLSDLSQMMQIDINSISALMEKYVYYLLGSLYAVPAVLAILYLMLARSWQLVISQPEKPRLEFRSIRMRRSVSIVFLALIVLACVWHHNWLSAMVVIATIPFIFAGFSLALCIGSIEGRNKYLRMGLLLIAIVILLFIAQIALLLLAVVGFMDSWVNFRKLIAVQLIR